MTNRRRVLVVDDEHLILQIIFDIFTGEGYDVVTAFNFDKALQLLKEDSFHAVLTDIRMPKNNGMDLLESIRVFNTDLPVIIMTGFASLETAMDAVKHGAFDYLTKPLDFNKLKSVLRHAIEKYELVLENRRLVQELQEINATLELKVKERNRELENILNSTHESIMTTDKGLIIKSTNPQTSKIFGREVIGLKLNDLLKGINFESIIPKLLSEGSYTTKHEIRFKDRFLEIALSRLVDFESGKEFGLTVVIEDITEKKKLEAQLIQSAKMSAIGQFATGLAHEFNNILSGIMGYTSFALSRTSIDKIREDLVIVERAASRASEIVTAILSFSRQREGERRLASVEEVIEDAIKLIEQTFKSFNIQILKHYAKVPPIIINVGEIQQVILNLALNSRDALSEGGVIAVSTGIDGDYIKIDFSDNGIGIPKKNLQKIFEPFFTTKKSGDTKSGTGLGLSVVYSIIERHGGRIEVSSEIGLGTTVTIRLPNIQRLSDSYKTDQRQENEAIEESKIKRKGNILVVDDEEFICDLVSDALVDFGHNIDKAKSGEAALILISDNHYDIIFLDLTIFGRSIIELFREMRVLDPSSVVVIISGTPDEEALDKLISEGAFSFIKKPFRINEIQNTVGKILGSVF